MKIRSIAVTALALGAAGCSQFGGGATSSGTQAGPIQANAQEGAQRAAPVAAERGPTTGDGAGWRGPGMMGGYGYGPEMMDGYGYGPGMMGGYGPGMMGWHGFGSGPGMMWGNGPRGRGWSIPGLTNEQRTKIAEIQKEFRQKQWALMQSMHELHFQSEGPYRDGSFDEQSARKSFDARETLRRQMFESSLEMRKRIDAVLTPRQREQMQPGRRGR